MSCKLAICIPSLDRKDLLLQSVKSVLSNKLSCDVDIVVSLNYCLDNSNILHSLKELNAGNLKIFVHDKLLSIDENMHYVIKNADSDYVYLLGDDDFFLNNSLEVLFSYIDLQHDLVVFQSSDKIKIDTPDIVFNSTESAFNHLAQRTPYGSILCKKLYFNFNYFKSLYGSSHAYNCFWISLFWKQSNNLNVSIVLSTQNIVYLRLNNIKTYSYYNVMYNDVPFGHKVRLKLLPPEISEGIYSKYVKRYYRQIYSFRSLFNILHYIDTDTLIKDIKVEKKLFIFLKIYLSYYIILLLKKIKILILN